MVPVVPFVQKQSAPPAPVRVPVKKENQWYDVGIVKVTNMVVTHYYVPADDSNYTEVRDFKIIQTTTT